MTQVLKCKGTAFDSLAVRRGKRLLDGQRQVRQRRAQRLTISACWLGSSSMPWSLLTSKYRPGPLAHWATILLVGPSSRVPASDIQRRARHRGSRERCTYPAAVLDGPAIAQRDQADDADHEQGKSDPDHLPRPGLPFKTEANQVEPRGQLTDLAGTGGSGIGHRRWGLNSGS